MHWLNIFLKGWLFRRWNLENEENSLKIIWVFLFSIAMAYLESVVVVYLRRIYGITDLFCRFRLLTRKSQRLKLAGN